MSPLIRLAAIGEVGVIHAALLRLGEDVGDTAKITSTPDDLRRHGFGENPAFRVLIAEVDGAFAGLALFFPSFSTWKGRPGVYVQDLYVEPGFRGRRVGEHLLRAVAGLAKAEGACYLRLSVAAGNLGAQRFYDQAGLPWMKDEMIRAAYGEDFDRLARGDDQ